MCWYLFKDYDGCDYKYLVVLWDDIITIQKIINKLLMKKQNRYYLNNR